MTAALIVASGKTAAGENLDPLKKAGIVSAIERFSLLFRQAGIQRVIVVHDESIPVNKWVPSMNLTFLTVPSGSGMLEHIKSGLSYFQEKAAKVLIASVDVPLFSLNTLRTLLAADADLCIPSYAGCRGFPILISAGHFPTILSCTDAKDLAEAIQSCGLTPRVLDVNDAGVISDLSKDGSYQRLFDQHDLSPMRASFRFRILKECAFYGPGPHLLLQLTEETGSLSEACRHMGISYSKGRKIISTMERQLGSTVIETQQGGKGGGYSHLTAEAKELAQCYDAFCAEAEESLQQLFHKHFASHFPLK